MSEYEMPMDAPVEEDQVATCTFKLNFLDFIGEPIEGLTCRVTLTLEDGGQQVLSGTTDAEGYVPPMENLPIGSTAMIEVKNDAGQYRPVGDVFIDFPAITSTAISPKVKIELLPMQLHEGEPGTIEDEIPDIACDPDVIVLDPGQLSVPPPAVASPAAPAAPNAKPRVRNLSHNVGVSSKPILKQGRDKNGKPMTVVLFNKGDWYEKAGAGVRAGIHWLWSWADFTPERKGMPTRARLALKNPPPAPEAVKELIRVAEQNTKLRINESPTSALTKRVNGKVDPSLDQKSSNTAPSKKADVKPGSAGLDQKPAQTEPSKKEGFPFDPSRYGDKPTDKPTGLCARYVNIALAEANISNGVMDLHYASLAGPQLLALGFREVTDEVPDGRWAAAGDVIVYQWSDKAWEEEKKTKGISKLPNYGHIDIRSYDSYISDYIPKANHPNWQRYADIKIYRKVYDLMPTLRMKAFLHCLREYECQAERDDAKRYQMLNTPLPNGEKRFTNFSKHPWYGMTNQLPSHGSGAAGAYQIIPKTWNAILFDPQTFRIVLKSGELLFDQKMQDRIAVAILESRKALASIRTGDIAKAIQLLQTEWTSLPGAKENVKRKTADGKPMDMNYFTALFNTYLNEEMKKENLA
jgi:muramidase (phage lysozyme)